MKKQQYANAVRSVEIRCKKTANAVPAVGEIDSSIAAAKFARQFYGDDIEIYESFFSHPDEHPQQAHRLGQGCAGWHQ